MAIDQQTIDAVIAFHGHMCPGLAMGIQAAEVALAEVGRHTDDDRVVAVVETDMCSVDAIQFLVGTTFGKGNLVSRDYGKNAYTFARPSSGRAVRVVGRPGAFPQPPAEVQVLMGRAREGSAAPAEREALSSITSAVSQVILSTPPGELFEVTGVDMPEWVPGRVFASAPCASCGEPTAETKLRKGRDGDVCLPCSERREHLAAAGAGSA